MSSILTSTLPSGLELVVEPIPNVASVAMNWMIPIGSASDPDDAEGLSTMLSELVFRGAGELDSRALSDAMDRLGIRRSCRVQALHLRLDATLLGDRLDEAVEVLAGLVLKPRLPAEAVDPVRNLCLQSLDALDDDPQHLVMLRLRQRHVRPPFNRHGYGDREALERTTREDLAGHWAARCRPAGSIITAAGAVDPDRLGARLTAALEGWTGACEEPEHAAEPARGYLHLESDTQQVHLGLAYDAPPEPDEHSMLERLATAVLSGSTSGRLFTEVRQKRALCYSVGASYRAGRDFGHVALYAGTTPQRAQETLDVCVAEIERLARGAEREEFDRAVTGLKSHLIMQGESTPARAAALGADQVRLGRARALEEVARAVDEISLDALNDYLARRVIGPYTIVSIGPEPLEAPQGLAAEVVAE
jgi:predicted Zn-dependent peptidase